jgi:hypothetical protein
MLLIGAFSFCERRPDADIDEVHISPCCSTNPRTFDILNTPALYPSGKHLEAAAINCGIERVRRTAICLEHLKRKAPELMKHSAIASKA